MRVVVHPTTTVRRRLVVGAALAVLLAAVAAALVCWTSPDRLVGTRHPRALSRASSPPLSPSPLNVYSDTAAGHFSPAVAGVPTRVYVPNSESNTVEVIDPVTRKVISSFPVPRRPQHVVPSADFKTLYVNSDLGNALTPIDPVTGKPGPVIPVADPYNLYFTPDGTKAIVVPELLSALDF